jgi:phage baseplate assembly protein V
VIDQVWRRLQLLFSPGVLTRDGNDRVQARLLSDEVLDNVRHVEPYGLSYRPLPGAQPYVFFPAGDRSTGFAIVTGDRRYQMRLEGGEVALHDHQGSYIHIKQTGEIEITATAAVTIKSPVEVVVDAPILRVTGQISATGGYYGEGGSAASLHNGANVVGEFTVNGKNLSDTHTHHGVLPGDGNTGTVN